MSKNIERYGNKILFVIADYYENISDKVVLIAGDITDLNLLKRIICEGNIKYCFQGKQHRINKHPHGHQDLFKICFTSIKKQLKC